MPCCGRPPGEVTNHRVSTDPARVTCRERQTAELQVDTDRGESPFGWSGQTAAAGPADQPPANPDDGGGILPPFSGDDAECPKCLHPEADTEYRLSLPVRCLDAFNGRHRPGPQPERLQRTCGRCGYQWDEALAVGEPGMTVDALAHAVDNASPYPYDLPREVCVFMARQLLEMCHVRARPDHALWRYDPGRPQPTVQPQPAPDPNGESA